MAKVLVKTISQEGYCAAGQKVGDEILFDWDNHEIQGKICLHALYSALPKIYALAHGGDVAFAEENEGNWVARYACPDGYIPVIYELGVI
ncbi:TIGR04076 family protein [Candidatus Bathyarchaeota archaeon]|nr:TIGR04076 family protein [Candidatus Bathyarchaeota archaeon]MBL7079103.1 TIGR04076 family protein [Candidatus Bathyarchaeota archaeon]